MLIHVLLLCHVADRFMTIVNITARDWIQAWKMKWARHPSQLGYIHLYNSIIRTWYSSISLRCCFGVGFRMGGGGGEDGW